MGQKQTTLQDTVFELKLKARELTRASAKSEKDQKVDELKVKRAIEKGNLEGARIFAQNSIRKKHEALSYLHLSSKMEATASRLEAAYNSQNMTKSVFAAVPKLHQALGTLDPAILTSRMSEFEELFETLDVRTDFVTKVIDSTIAASMPEDQVTELITKVAEEYALDVTGYLNEVNSRPLASKIDEPVAIAEKEMPTAVAVGDGGLQLHTNGPPDRTQTQRAAQDRTQTQQAAQDITQTQQAAQDRTQTQQAAQDRTQTQQAEDVQRIIQMCPDVPPKMQAAINHPTVVAAVDDVSLLNLKDRLNRLKDD